MCTGRLACGSQPAVLPRVLVIPKENLADSKDGSVMEGTLRFRCPRPYGSDVGELQFWSEPSAPLKDCGADAAGVLLDSGICPTCSRGPGLLGRTAGAALARVSPGVLPSRVFLST